MDYAMRSKEEAPDKIDQHIQEDIQSFRDIITSIDIILDETNTQQEIKESLEKIALSSQKIHRNGKRDGKERYLRNKYSTNDYVKDKIRPSGINFDLLSEIKSLPDDILTQEYADIFSDIKELLKSVKQKLEFAIQAEQGLIDHRTAIIKFKDLSKNDLKEQILKKAILINAGKIYFLHILKILGNLSGQTFNLKDENKEDRYFLGINLAMIGETAKKIEIISDLDEGVLRTFKLFRNRNAHNMGFMARAVSDEQDNMYKFILDKLVRDLKKVAETAITRFDEVKSKEQLINLDISFSTYSVPQRSILKKLLGIVSGEKNIILTAEDLSKFDPEIKENSEETTQSKLDDKVEVHIAPAAAAAAIIKKTTKNIISSSSKEDKTLEAKIKSLRKIINKKTHSEKEDNIKFDQSDIDKGKDFVRIINDAVRKNGNMDFPFFQEDVFPTEEDLEKINKYLKKHSALRNIQIIEPSKDSDVKSKKEQTDITLETKANNIKINKSDLVKKYEFIAKEIDLIFSVIDKTSISDFKKECIVKFAVTKIGQTIRDIEESGADKPVYNLQSEMHKKSTRISAESRNRIMHNILDQDFNSSLAINLFRHILPLLNDIQALSNIIQNKTDNVSMLVSEKKISQLMLVARSYTELTKYEKAIELYKEILFFIGIGKREDDLNLIITEFDKNCQKIAKEIYPLNFTISNDVFNCFYLISYNYGLIANVLKLNGESAKLYEDAYKLKIKILDALLELKKDIPDRQSCFIR
jgi:hypothetical protein